MAYTHHDLNDRERRVLALLGGHCPCPVDHGPADDDELTDSLEHYRRRYVTGVDDELDSGFYVNDRVELIDCHRIGDWPLEPPC